METFWFIAVVAMLTVYVVLDGFDFGTGIVYLWVARTDEERRTALRAIAPVWNGNEVWLLASGGLIFFAFPKAYAAGFSGFYLALMLVLWLLMFRGLALELRSHFAHPLWRTFWDAAFAGASLLLAIVFGAALGNLLRGVPLTQEGYFFTPFWTTFTTGPAPGILDWFTVLMGLTGAAVLTVHGADYLAMKIAGELAERANRVARMGSYAVVVLLLVVFAAMPFVQPALRHNYEVNPLGYVFPLVAFLSLASMMLLCRMRRDGAAFAASSLFIASLLGSAAWGLYPNLLLATSDPAYSLTIRNASAGSYGLQVGLVWFSLGLILVVAYTLYMYRSFRGTIETLSKEAEDHY
jgi:cytochrome d ubiquinol oxidase subunit II